LRKPRLFFITKTSRRVAGTSVHPGTVDIRVRAEVAAAVPPEGLSHYAH
jgi:hypothetical protein